MCDVPRTQIEERPHPHLERDVDDLIFRNEQEWLTSDR